MATSTDDERSALQRLAAALLGGADRIAMRSVERMQELVPAYAQVPAAALHPVALTNTHGALEAVLDPRANPIVTLKHAQRALRANDEKAESLMSEALEQAQQGNAELRELAHGILPAVLAQRGLSSGVNTIISRLDLPVAADIPAERFPAEIEASAYFVVAEALTNVVKHSHAGRAEVRAWVQDGLLRVEVSDDGIGGADPSGHGLVGLHDRVTALGGRLEVSNPAAGGTLLSATLPISAG